MSTSVRFVTCTTLSNFFQIHNKQMVLDSIADFVYDSDDDTELAQIEDDNVRLQTKRDRLAKDFSKGFKTFAPTIATAIGFMLMQKCT